MQQLEVRPRLGVRSQTCPRCTVGASGLPPQEPMPFCPETQTFGGGRATWTDYHKLWGNLLEPLSLQLPPDLPSVPTGPRGRGQAQGTRRSMALGQGPDSQVESFQMPHDSAWPSAPARGRWCLKPAPSRWLAAEIHWLELKAAWRWQWRLLQALAKELYSHDFWMTDSSGGPPWAARVTLPTPQSAPRLQPRL